MSKHIDPYAPDGGNPPLAAVPDDAQKDPGPQPVSIAMVVYTRGALGTENITLDLPEVFSWGNGPDGLTIVAPSKDKASNQRVQHFIPRGEYARFEVRTTFDRDLS